jgi:AcrR family transcriptional regulator
MPKLSPEMANARREEIIAACETLYEKMGFKDLTLKEIAKYTSLSRPSIYNYFETKEEIFLAILQKEYWSWVEALNREIEEHETMSKDMVAEVIARTLCDHPQILKIVSMNHYDMEANSRVERLIEFKKSYGATLKAVDRLLIKFCKDMTAQDRQAFLYSFFPFIYGIYPYTVVTDKQKRAMEQAIVPYVYYSAYDLTYQFVKKLLG